jgi:3-methyladenine DNA glycosylase AlkD
MRYEEIIERLKQEADPECVAGMARFGINPDKTLGISIPFLWNLSKEIGKDHELAGQLWRSGIHEARILAGIIDEPEKVTEKQMESWVRDFDSWDICDQVCSRLFDKTPFAYKKVHEWTKRDEEFVKRAGFAMMAALVVHDKKASDKEFERFLPMIVREAKDERNYVRKAVNWALRTIGKRNKTLNRKAIRTAERIRKINSKSARWIATDALRELRSDAVQRRLK